MAACWVPATHGLQALWSLPLILLLAGRTMRQLWAHWMPCQRRRPLMRPVPSRLRQQLPLQPTSLVVLMAAPLVWWAAQHPVLLAPSTKLQMPRRQSMPLHPPHKPEPSATAAAAVRQRQHRLRRLGCCGGWGER